MPAALRPVGMSTHEHPLYCAPPWSRGFPQLSPSVVAGVACGIVALGLFIGYCSFAVRRGGFAIIEWRRLAALLQPNLSIERSRQSRLELLGGALDSLLRVALESDPSRQSSWSPPPDDRPAAITLLVFDNGVFVMTC